MSYASSPVQYARQHITVSLSSFSDLSPVASGSLTVDPEEISSSNVREDDIVTENGVTQSLTSFASASSVIVQIEDPNGATTAL